MTLLITQRLVDLTHEFTSFDPFNAVILKNILFPFIFKMATYRHCGKLEKIPNKVNPEKI